MIKKEIKTEPREVITDVICDCCGESCLKKITNENHPDYGKSIPADEGGLEYLDLSVNWGYHSDHDLERWTAQVCEKCVVEKLQGIIKFRKENCW